jgi:hypothetical protein
MNGTVCSKLICPITGNSQSYRSQPSLRQRRPRKITFSPPPTTVQDKRARESRLYWIRQRACAAYREECGRDLSKDESLLQKLVNCQSVDFYSWWKGKYNKNGRAPHRICSILEASLEDLACLIKENRDINTPRSAVLLPFAQPDQARGHNTLNAIKDNPHCSFKVVLSFVGAFQFETRNIEECGLLKQSLSGASCGLVQWPYSLTRSKSPALMEIQEHYSGILYLFIGVTWIFSVQSRHS